MSKDADKGPKTIHEIREQVRQIFPYLAHIFTNVCRLPVLTRKPSSKEPASKPPEVAVVPEWAVVMLVPSRAATETSPLQTTPQARSAVMTSAD